MLVQTKSRRIQNLSSDMATAEIAESPKTACLARLDLSPMLGYRWILGVG